MILSLSNLSEAAATWWLDASGITLLVSAIVLTIGIIGEWPDSESWKRRKLYKLAKLAVVLGVVGELVGDAGVFETSARLTTLQHVAVEQANTKAANAEERAGYAIRDAAAMNERAAALERDAAQLKADAADAALRLELLRQSVAPRRIDRDTFLGALEGWPKATFVEILYLRDDPDCRDVAQQIFRLLLEAKWKSAPANPIPPANTYPNSQLPTVLSAGGQPSGVTLVTHSPVGTAIQDSLILGKHVERTPFLALFNALLRSLGGMSSNSDGAVPEGSLRVVVGPRL